MNNKLFRILIIFWVLLYILLSFYRIFNTNLFWDGSYHTQFFMQNFRDQTLTYLHDNLFWHYWFPRLQQFTLNYPALYHLIWWVFYGFWWLKTAYFLDMLFGFIIILFILVLLKDKKNQIIWFLTILCWWFYIAAWNNNLIFVLWSMFLVYTLYKISVTKADGKHIVLFIIFSIFSFWLKQFIYFAYPLLFLYFSYILYVNKKIKYLIFSFFSIIVWIVPIMWRQIHTTWTLSTQTIEWWPIIDKHIFKPRHFQLEPRQYEIDKIVDINKLNEQSAKHYYSINVWLKDLFSVKFINNLFFNNYNILPSFYKNYYTWTMLFLLLVVFGIIYLYKREKKIFVILTFLLISWVIVYKFTSKIEYSLTIPISLLIMIIFWIRFILNFSNKYRIVLLLLITSLLIHIINWIKLQEFFINQTYNRIKPYNSASFNDLLLFLRYNKNVDKTKLFFHWNSQEFPFYVWLKTFSDYRLYFLNNEQLKHYLPYYINKWFKYVVFFNGFIKNEFTNWNVIYTNSYFYRNIIEEKWFKKIYQNDDFSIYEITDIDNTISWSQSQ